MSSVSDSTALTPISGSGGEGLFGEIANKTFGYLGSSNMSEMGKLMQQKALSPKEFLIGRSIDKTFDAVNGLIELGKIKAETTAKISYMAVVLAEKTISAQQGLVVKVIEAQREQLQFFKNLYGSVVEFTQKIEKATDEHMGKLAELIATYDDRPTLLNRMLDNQEKVLALKVDGLKSSIQALTALGEAAQFNQQVAIEFVQQSAEVIREINLTVRLLATEDSKRIKEIVDGSMKLLEKSKASAANLEEGEGTEKGPAKVTDQSQPSSSGT